MNYKTLITEYNTLITHLIEQRDSLLAEFRDSCKHSNVLQGEYRPSTHIIDALPDFRVCVDCGIEEEGWGCGYKVLVEAPNRKIKEVKRDVAYKARGRGPRKEVGNSILVREIKEEETHGR